MPHLPLDQDPPSFRRSGVRSSPQLAPPRSYRLQEPAWIRWFLIGALGVVWILRWRLEGYLPESYALWWRSAYAWSGGEAADPAFGLYSPPLPLFQILTQGLLGVAAWIRDIHSLASLQGLAVVIGLWVGLWCWGRGNLWSLGLWGLSPWVVELGLEPNSEILAALCLFLGSVTSLPQRFLWLGLACGISSHTWPLALILALWWTVQRWPRYRLLGLYVVSGAILLTLIWSRFWSWLGPAQISLPMHASTWQIWLSVLAPLSLCLGLVIVRVRWPWHSRHQAGIGMVSGLYLGVALLTLWLWGWRGDLWVEAVTRIGIVVLPLLCYVAGGVLEELRSTRWRQGLGILVLLASLALSSQSLYLWSYRALLLQPAQLAAQWLQDHRSQIQGILVVDSAAITYLSRLPVEQLISSGAAQRLYGDVLAEPVEWVVINQAEAAAWDRSRLLQDHPEFATTSEIPGWDLVYINQEVIPPISPRDDPHRSLMAALSQPSIGIPIVQIWHRSATDSEGRP